MLVVLVEGASTASLVAVAAALDRPLRTAIVRGETDAADAVLAAVEGGDLVIEVSPATSDALIERLVDDLRRVGSLRHLTSSGLHPDAAALLELLRAGHTVSAAAAALHLSRRSAERRLAAARELLGVATNAQAVMATPALFS